MNDDDPVRLKVSGQASPELVRALRALGDPAPDAARLARVAEKLGAALADAPPQPSLTSGMRLIATKGLVIAIVATGVAALTWFAYEYSRRPADQDEDERGRGAIDAPSIEQTLAPPAAIAESREISPAARPALAAPRPTTVPAKRAGRRGSLVRGPSLASAPRSQPSVTAPVPPVPPVAPVPMVAAESVPVAPIAASEDEARAHSEPAVTQPLPAPRSEAALLLDARSMLQLQPLAAAALLDEHAARFPKGRLGPEREVLRIEVLRKLGRTAEADQRLRAFESRYPNSIHLRRLQKPAPASTAND